MLVKEITYEDFDGASVTETCHFHLAKSELVEFNLVTKGGIEGNFKKLMEAGDVQGILALFKDIIRRSYGILDPANPRKFTKPPAAVEEFMNSGAFDALYMELMTSETAGKEFITGIMPKSMANSPEVVVAVAQAYSGDGAMATSGTGVIKATAEDVQLPDDTKAWPRDNGDQPLDNAAGLVNPRDDDGNLLPWAFREPTQIELTEMTKQQMADCFRRKGTDWRPFQFKS